jgi:hypothetical protein
LTTFWLIVLSVTIAKFSSPNLDARRDVVGGFVILFDGPDLKQNSHYTESL